MVDKVKQVEDLKSFAGKACIDIFNDFDYEEVKSMPPSIIEAWNIGRALCNVD